MMGRRFAGEPERQLVAAVLLRAVKDLEEGQYLRSATAFLRGELAGTWMAWLGIEQRCVLERLGIGKETGDG